MESDKLPNGWHMATLAEIARQDGYGLVDGPFGSNLPASAYVPSGIPVIRGSNLSLGNARFRDDEFVFVSDETAKRLSRSLCSINDIIFTKKGTLGQTGIIPAQSRYPIFLLSSNQMKLSVDQKIANPQFVYYYISSPASRGKIIRDSEATGVPKTNLAYLRTFPILLPPLSEQHSIAHLLGTLDDKIDLNQQMNNTLEGIAQALFKSWFVDFDPIKAKAEGRKPEGMDDAIASLFPSAFTESILGPIPEGWIVDDLGNLSNIAIGRTPPRKEPEWFTENPSHNKWISIRDLGEASVFIVRASEYLTNEAVEKFRIPLIKAGTVVLSFKLTLGRVAIAAEDMYSNEAIAQFSLDKSPLNSIYLYFCLKSYNYNNLGNTSSIATAVNSQILKTIKILVAQPAILAAFEKLTLPIIQKIKSNLLCTKILSETRDLLLPRLISGKLQVDEISETVEALAL